MLKHGRTHIRSLAGHHSGKVLNKLTYIIHFSINGPNEFSWRWNFFHSNLKSILTQPSDRLSCLAPILRTKHHHQFTMFVVIHWVSVNKWIVLTVYSVPLWKSKSVLSKSWNVLNANISTSSNCFFFVDLKEFYERSSFSHGKVTNKQADPHIFVAVHKRRSLTPVWRFWLFPRS